MKTSEIQKSSHHQQQRTLKSEKPFFSTNPEHAFFSTQRAAPTPFFSPQSSSAVALQAKPADSDAEKLSQEAVEEPETLTLQRTRDFASDNNQVQPLREHPLLTLQRQLGNRVVTQMIQAKLTVGKPNDHYEQEADRVANTVMRMPDPLAQLQSEDKKEEVAQMRPLVVPISRLVQRQVDKQEEPIQTLQRQTTEENKEEPIQTLQRQTTGENKEEPIQTLQRQTTEENKEEPIQTLQRQTTEENKEEPIQTLQRQTTGENKEEPIQTLQRQTTGENKEEPIQTKEMASAVPQVSTNVESNIQGMRGGGQPLLDSTRTFFESRFGYDFGGVRVHTGTNANEAANSLNAQAFTVGQDIFFNSGRYEPHTSNGKWLLAHELTHTVQQQSQSQSTANNFGQATTTPSVQNFQRKPLPLSTASRQIQRFDFGLPGIDTVRNWAADRAANIPGFTMLTVILGRNPINNRPVERNATNLIRGALGLVPGGELIFQGLQASGAIEPVAIWLQQQIAQLNISWENIVELFAQALRSLSPGDILDIGGAAERLLNIFRPTLERIRAFATGVGRRVIQFIKEAILRPVGQFAQQLPFYPLLTVILGKDPITDEVVERNATTVIRGILMILPGGEEKFQNLQRSGIIARAYNWFNEQLTRLNLTWNYIKSIFVRLWETLSIRDILSPLAAFERIRNIFSEPVRRITTFAGAAVRKVAEFIFEGVLTLAGGLGRQVLSIFNQARSVLSTIIENPIGFIGNLVNSVKRGFQQFAGNILTHLRGGLIGWLFGALAGAGLQLPERFDLRGIVSLVMQILGLTYQRLRGILVRLLGSEERVQRAEQIFDFLATLVRDGITAAWQRIVEFVGNLQEMVIGGIRDWVARTVVGQAIARLVTLFNPAGAVIQAIMAIYNTIVFFIERAQQIGAVVESVFGSIASIAAGNIGAAANLVERTMARTIPVILGFLARFIGLGNVGEQIQNLIRKIQTPIERAMERVANWIATQVRRLVGAIVGGARGLAQSILNWWQIRKGFRTEEGENHSVYFRGEGASSEVMVASQEMPLSSLLTAKRSEIETLTGRSRTRKENALNRAEELLRQITNIKRTLSNTPNHPQAERLKEDLNGLFNDLADQIVILGMFGASSRELPKTQVDFQPQGSKAGKVIADPLTKHEGNTHGSRPKEEPDGWANHIKTIPNYSNYYVRLHILSELLHGPGINANLTPGRKTENTSMESQAEGSAYQLIQRNKVLWYEGEVTGYRSEVGYTDFAEGIRIKYGFKEVNDTGDWVRVSGAEYDRIFSVTKPDPKGTRNPIPTLNTISRDYARTLDGLPNYAAMERIIAGRGAGYSSWDEFENNAVVKVELAKNPNLLSALKANIPNKLIGF